MRRALCAAALVLLVAGCGGSSSGIRVAHEVDVSSRLSGQLETAIAVDPHNPKVLLAGSNTLGAPTTEVYSSTDGGRSWTASPGPPLPSGYKFASDPGVAIGGNGREYFSFLASRSEDRGSLAVKIFVTSRSGPRRDWDVARVSGDGGDKPAIAVDGTSGRVYTSWTQFTPAAEYPFIDISHSDDGGRTWTRPSPVVGVGLQQYSTLAVSRTHTAYLAWDDYVQNSDVISRSQDGKMFLQQVNVAHYRAHSSPTRGCDGFVIRAQPHNCIHSDPSIGLTHGRVIVTWGAQGPNGSQNVYERAFSSALKPEGKPHVVIPDGRRPSDQFWPATAVDPSTDRLWLCFYDTRGDPSRKKVRYSCTDSWDGGTTWAKLVRVASVASNASIKSGRNGADYGDYEGLAAGHGLADAIWADTRNWTPWEEDVFTATLTP
jgi:hypothetical protein